MTMKHLDYDLPPEGQIKKLKGDFSPLDFEVDVINTIILNKRKQDLFDKLRDSIYNNSTRGVDYEIY